MAMKLYGSGGKHKKNTDPESMENIEYIEQHEFTLEPETEPEYAAAEAFNE